MQRLVAAAAALAVLVGLAGLALHQTAPARGVATGADIGSVVPSPLLLTPSAGPSSATPSSSPSTAVGLLETHSTELGAQGDDGGQPTAVSIPRLHVQARTTPAGVSRDNHSLQLPASARAVVWWAYGATPGTPYGTVLLAGHVSWNGRLGALTGLRLLRLGDVVGVTRRDGTVVRYAVTGRRHVPKASLDELGVFAPDGAARLVLVTCGGRYDAARRSYEDNVVVVARPL